MLPTNMETDVITRQRIRALCALDEAPCDSINVAILKQSLKEKAEVDKNDVLFVTSKADATISDLIQSCRAKYPRELIASVALLDNDVPIAPDREILQLTESTSRNFLIMRKVSNDTNVNLDSDIEANELWKIFVHKSSALQADKKTPEKFRKKLASNWEKLSPNDVLELQHHRMVLNDILSDAIRTRAFYIWYHRQMQILMNANNHSISLRACLEIVHQEWQKIKQREIADLYKEASVHLHRYPVPTPLPDTRLALPFKCRSGSSKETAEDKLVVHVKHDLLDSKHLSVDALQRQLKTSAALLGEVRTAMEAVNVTDRNGWIAQIQQSQKLDDVSQTKIGIVGASGAGKSSVINAILNESKIVGISCWRACTAVATEICYNHSPDDNYRAVIDFLSEREWTQELTSLFSDVEASDGNVSAGSTSGDEEKGIARSKFAAVYPTLDITQQSEDTVANLMHHDNVKELLGQSWEYTAESADELQERLSAIIETKDSESSGRHSDAQQVAHWPIIRGVKLFTRSALLKDGVVLVDLPGVHDSNKARAAIAAKHSKQCSNLFIVAPIARAVNDQSAKEILDGKIRQQMMLDGKIDSVVFIATKIDDIGPWQEVASTLGLSDQMNRFEQIRKELTIRLGDLRNETQQHANERARHSDELERQRLESRHWRLLKRKIKNGEDVYEEQASGLKRKGSTAGLISPEPKRVSGAHLHGTDNSASLDTEHVNERRKLGSSDIDDKLETLANHMDALLDSSDRLVAESRHMDEELKRLEVRLGGLEEEKWRSCVTARSSITRNSIKQGFRDSIKEFDTMMAAKDPGFKEDIGRDYDKMADDLPVFCVSARGYQRLNSARHQGAVTDQFSSLEQTEIPALRDYIRKLSDISRAKYLTSRLTRDQLLLGSINMWALERSICEGMSKARIDEERSYMHESLGLMRKDIISAVSACLRFVDSRLKNQLFAPLVKAENTACKKAIEKSASWGYPPAQGGLHFMTYKATCRRNGVHVYKGTDIDFNAALSQLVFDSVSKRWDFVFQKLLPETIDEGTRNSTASLDAFYHCMAERGREIASDTFVARMITSQRPQYVAVLTELFQKFKYQTQLSQQQANRAFNPSIEESMLSAYEDAAGVKGPGAFKRMKNVIEGAVQNLSKSMFKHSGDKVRKILRKSVLKSSAQLIDTVKEVIVKVERDCISLYSPEKGAISIEETQLKKNIASILKEYSKTEFKEGRVGKDEPQLSAVKDTSLLTEPIVKQEPEELDVGCTHAQGNKVMNEHGSTKIGDISEVTEASVDGNTTTPATVPVEQAPATTVAAVAAGHMDLCIADMD